jgi:hypothetical protein
MPCTKQAHKSKGAAEAQLRSITRRGLYAAPGELRSYWCPQCQAWHIGHYIPVRFTEAGERVAPRSMEP